MRGLVVLAVLTFSLPLAAVDMPAHPGSVTVSSLPQPLPGPQVDGVLVAGRSAAQMGIKLVNVAKALRALSGLDLTMGVSFAVADTSVKKQFDSVNNSISFLVKGAVQKMTAEDLASTYGQFMQTDVQQLAGAARNNKTMAIGSLAKVAIEKAKIILAETKDPSQLPSDFMVVVSWLFFLGKTISEQGGGNVLAQSVVKDVEISPSVYERKPSAIQ